MLPESLATFYAFLGLVAPGLTYELLRETRRPALKQSPFREASRVALTSVLFTTAAIVLVGLLGSAFPGMLPDLERWLLEGEAYAADHLRVIVVAISLEVVIACGLAAGATVLVGKLWGTSKRAIVSTSVWYQLFDHDLPRDTVAWVLVELKNGLRIWGFVDFFTLDSDSETRELTLKGPGLATQTASGERKREEYWKYVAVDAREISVIKIAHEPAAIRRPQARHRVRWREGRRPNTQATAPATPTTYADYGDE